MDAVSFISSLILHFPVRHENPDKEKAWALAIKRELHGFPSEVLEKASQSIIRNRKDRRFPVLAELRGACVEAKRWLDIEGSKADLIKSSQPAGSHLDWTADRLKLATDLCMSPMGREAAKEGWVQQLHDFARKNSRLPQPGEIGALKREAKAFDEAYARCVKGGWPQAEKLELLGAMTLKRREDLVDRVLHGVVG